MTILALRMLSFRWSLQAQLLLEASPLITFSSVFGCVREQISTQPSFYRNNASNFCYRLSFPSYFILLLQTTNRVCPPNCLSPSLYNHRVNAQSIDPWGAGTNSTFSISKPCRANSWIRVFLSYQHVCSSCSSADPLKSTFSILKTHQTFGVVKTNLP